MTDHKNKKQKLMSLLTLLGVLFVIALAIGAYQSAQNRGELIVKKVAVPEDFAAQFSRVITKNREEPMKPVPFLTPEGKSVSWSDFEGQYLLVNFWATWCAPCVLELPSLGRLKKRYADKGLEVIAISIDMGRTHSEIKEFLLNRNLGEFAAHFDSQNVIQKNIYMRGIPTSYLLDPKGNILHVFEGDAYWDSPSSFRFFDEILG